MYTKNVYPTLSFCQLLWQDKHSHKQQFMALTLMNYLVPFVSVPKITVKPQHLVYHK